jgi:GDP/UDP-N,N'-diacetylbacillosamine 2-epimerase (hydrolysing)
MPRKILFIAGSRGEYGYIRPIIRQIEQDPDMEYEVLVTNMHLLPKFGESLKEFEKDNIKVDYKIFNTLDGYNNLTMAKSLGIFLLQIPEILEKSKPDIVLISGDRGEHLMAAIAASHMNIPVAHIQAGEKSGNIDGVVRHAITKMSHIHFSSNEDSYNRVKNLGEQEFRIFNTGAPLVDELLEHDDSSFADILEKYKINKNKKIFLIVNHSITEEPQESGSQMKSILESINEFDSTKIIIMPNSDAGNLNIRKQLSIFEKRDDYKIFYNLPREIYINFLRNCDVMIGNSSSGIMEAPTFKKPVINIGRRQLNRFAANNVIHVKEYDKESIVSSIKTALSEQFIDSIKNIKNPYGEHKVSENIKNVLKNIEVNPELLNKEITY